MEMTLKTISGRTSPANQAGWWTPFDMDRFGNKYFVSCIVPINGQPTSKHNVMVSKEIQQTGEVVSGYCFDGAGRMASWLNDVGHNCPSIAIDANGFIHVFTSMHTNEIRYYRSEIPHDVTTMKREFFDWPDTGWQYTYPSLTKDASGNVYVMVRCGVQNQTILTHRMGAIYKWTPTEIKDVVESVIPVPLKCGKWSRVKLMFWEEDRSFYPDDIKVDSDGNLNIIYECGPKHAGTLRHRGTMVKMNQSSFGLTDYFDSPVTTPVTTRASQQKEVYQDLVSGEDFFANGTAGETKSAGIQTAKMIWDSDQKKVYGIAYRYRPMKSTAYNTFGGFGLRVAKAENGAWVNEDVFTLDSSDVSTSAAISSIYTNGKVYIYFSLEKGNLAWLCCAYNDGSSWKYKNITRVTGYTKPLRFQIEKYRTADNTYDYHVGYLTTPNMNVLYSVTIDVSDSGDFISSFDDLVSSL